MTQMIWNDKPTSITGKRIVNKYSWKWLIYIRSRVFNYHYSIYVMHEMDFFSIRNTSVWPACWSKQKIKITNRSGMEWRTKEESGIRFFLTANCFLRRFCLFCAGQRWFAITFLLRQLHIEILKLTWTFRDRNPKEVRNGDEWNYEHSVSRLHVSLAWGNCY